MATSNTTITNDGLVPPQTAVGLPVARTAIIPDDDIVSPQIIREAISNGGLFSRTIEGNTYVTEVTLDQEIVNEYQTVNQYRNTIVNQPSGSTGMIQYNNGGNFGSNVFFRYDEPGLTLYVNGTANVGNLITIGFTTTNLTATGNANLGTLKVTGFSTFEQNVAIGNSTTNRNLTVNGNITSGNIVVGSVGNPRTITVNGNIQAGNIDSGNLLTANFIDGVFEVNSNAQPNITSVADTLQVGNIYILGDTATPEIQGALDQPIGISANSSAGGGTIYTLTVDTDGNIVVPQALSGNAVLETNGDMIIRSVSREYIFDQNGAVNLANSVTANFYTGVFTVAASSQPNITSVGTLLSLVVSNGGIGNITGDNITSLDKTTTANLVVTDTANVDLANIGNLFVTANANVEQLNATNGFVTGNLNIGGNLYVQGTTVSVNVSELLVEDPIVVLGGGPNGAPLTTNDGKDRGVQLSYYTTSTQNAFMGWDNSNSEFAFGSDVTVTNEVVTFNALGNVRAEKVLANTFAGGNVNAANIVATGNIDAANFNGGNLYGNFKVASDTQVIFNDSGNLAGEAGLTYDKTTDALTAVGTITGGNLSTAGNITVTGHGNIEIMTYNPPVANSLVIVGTPVVGSYGSTDRLIIDCGTF